MNRLTFHEWRKVILLNVAYEGRNCDLTRQRANNRSACQRASIPGAAGALRRHLYAFTTGKVGSSN